MTAAAQTLAGALLGSAVLLLETGGRADRLTGARQQAQPVLPPALLSLTWDRAYTGKELIGRLGVSRQQGYARLAELCAQGLLRREGRWHHYRWHRVEAPYGYQ